MIWVRTIITNKWRFKALLKARLCDLSCLASLFGAAAFGVKYYVARWNTEEEREKVGTSKGLKKIRTYTLFVV